MVILKSSFSEVQRGGPELKDMKSEGDKENGADLFRTEQE